MAQHEDKNCGCEEDGCADAFAAVAIITLFACVMTFWLHGMA